MGPFLFRKLILILILLLKVTMTGNVGIRFADSAGGRRGTAIRENDQAVALNA
jgi:hypothetical protein